MWNRQHLLSLINDVLDMSRIESGKVKIEEKAVHLPDLVHDVRSIIQPDVSAKRLSLFIDTMDVENEDIITDPLRLNQILLNILSNAIKFTPTGGTISIRIAQKNGAPKGRGCYEFRIKDNGIGMSEEFQKHIFEAFSREESSTVSGIQGTGLGMSITKNIVDLMGGTIAIESEPGKGSEFIVNLCFALSGQKVELRQLPRPLTVPVSWHSLQLNFGSSASAGAACAGDDSHLAGEISIQFHTASQLRYSAGS